MKNTFPDFDFDFEIPNFDGLLDELDLSLDGLDFDFDLSDDPTSNRERTERKPPVEDC